MANVKLINYTGIGHKDPLFAARILAYTKNTRMNMDPDGLGEFLKKPSLEITKEIEYMSNTIPSSWEFVDVSFLIQGVSRAIAQQITRTRTASFAMQSQRVTDVSSSSWDHLPVRHDDPLGVLFDAAMKTHIKSYKTFLNEGVPLEDARNLLPMGIHCNLVAKYNLRNFVELCRARDSLRVQGPYREIVRQMKQEVLMVWPWAEVFFEHKEKKAINLIEEVAVELQSLFSDGGALYKGLHGKLAKAADLLKK